ncbi:MULTISPECIES: GntR family transcriptional regulator [unclassified Streptomyces]|uniref:GntR family transcriptional regulator n=1 Tax=unclassified Streptomyces TaxID=2593676 RepID=UPI00202E5129|nr:MULTISPECIES: GntR family transcriptional regulator [unclassified Streptomyces]MCM1971387.1 GntR family transcriptional regulator [Streptomyces sp. G1]MCX5298996.1 GntR family transcriptional regulator [Streptomyces sp. NBC_00193]
MTLSSSETAGSDPRPLHARIAADLRDEIMSGNLAPGSKLPSTSRLKSRFDASNATIQKAVQLLKDEGLAVGRAGAAVTVRDTRQRTVRPAGSLAPAADGAAYPWLAEASEPARPAHSTLLAVEEVPLIGDVAAALGLPEGSPAVCRRQLITIEDEPAELVSSYYPPELARGTALAEPRRIRGGTPTLLTELGFAPLRSVDRLSARVATQEQYTALRLPGDLPVLRTLRTVYGEDGRPIEVTVMVKAGHLYELQYEFTPEA